MPEEVRRTRENEERKFENNRRILEPYIEAHLTGYVAALDELEQAHRLVADETSLRLDAATRQSAIWLVMGRCIGLARASYDLIAAGYVVEPLPVLRSLHEASRLLTLVMSRGEDDLVRRWLDGRSVSRGQIMAAIDRQEQAAREEMIREGIKPPSATRGFLERQYGRWSEFAHHRRGHMLRQVSVPLRMMVIGPSPDWRARALIVDHYGWFLAEVVSAGSAAFGRLLGADVHERIQATFEALIELKRRIPLDEVARGDEPEDS